MNIRLAIYLVLLGIVPAYSQSWDSQGDNTTTGSLTVGSSITATGDIVTSGWLKRDDGVTDLLMYRDGDVGAWSLLRSNKGNGIAIIGEPDVIGVAVSRINSFVGIGTTSPAEKLHVNGSIRIPLASSTDNDSPGIVALSNHDFSYDGQFINHYGLGFHNFAEDGGFNGINAYMSGYYGVDLFTGGQNRLRVSLNGNVLIGKTTQNNPNHKLDVAGSIRANEIVVNTTGADYVFEKDYQLKSLDEVETFINQNNHLPGIPSAAEMQEQGMSIGELNIKLLEKIEELTLHTINQQKEIKQLKLEKDSLRGEVEGKIEELTLYLIELKKENLELNNRIKTIENEQK